MISSDISKNNKNKFNSKKYWEDRYKNGGNSGSGSYNKLAEFKAKIINDFIAKNNVNSIIDYGIDDGNQLKLINTENKKYTGIDISQTIIDKCKELFKNDNTKKFILDTEIDIDNLKSNLGISCDVIHHLIEKDEYIKYMKILFNISTSYVIIYSKNENLNYKSHIKFRKFTDYINENFINWILVEHIPNIYPQLILGRDNDTTSPSNFYIYKKSILKPNLILTARFGDNVKFLNLTQKYMKKYAIKCNADLEIITDRNYIKDWNFANKFKIGRRNNYSYLFKFLSVIHYLKYYEKVLWLDDTCFVKNNCENLFNMISSDKYILAYSEGENDDLNSWKHDCDFIFKKVGFQLNRKDYINSGVVIYTKKMLNIINYKNILEYNYFLSSEYPHQCLLNFLLQKNNTEILKLSECYNTMFLNCTYENGKEITKNEINSSHILSDKSKIFHITGFYKNRYSIAEHIDDTLKQLDIPVYVSLTSIFSKQSLLVKTLKSIIIQTRLPNKIFLYLSENSYLLDEGFRNKMITCCELSNFLKIYKNLIEICWVDNNGPYRKLLPLLKEKWNEDCIIITIDDDTVYNKNLIKKMVNDYIEHKCVVNYRGFSPLLDSSNNLDSFDYNKKRIRISGIPKNGYKDLYNFPTGVAGILYKPSFFHKTDDLIFNKEIYLKTCNKCDDVWFYLIRIKNNVECFLRFDSFSTENLSNSGLFLTFNKYDNNNTVSLRNTFKIINKL
jgi:hypothetical protein